MATVTEVQSNQGSLKEFGAMVNNEDFVIDGVLYKKLDDSRGIRWDNGQITNIAPTHQGRLVTTSSVHVPYDYADIPQGEAFVNEGGALLLKVDGGAIGIAGNNFFNNGEFSTVVLSKVKSLLVDFDQ